MANLFTSYANSGPIFRALGITANTTFTVRAGDAIRAIWINNRTSNAVTGGIKIGTTSGGTQVVVAQAVAADAKIKIADSALVKSFFSEFNDKTLFVQAVTSWNSASLDICVDMIQTGFLT